MDIAATAETDKSKNGSTAIAIHATIDNTKRQYPAALRIIPSRYKYSHKEHDMRFREFAVPAKPILKISQRDQEAATNTAATPLPQNTAPMPVPAEPVKVYPRTWQHEWVQKYLAAKMAQSAQTITPTADDMAMAYFKYGEAQSAADAYNRRRTGKTAG